MAVSFATLSLLFLLVFLHLGLDIPTSSAELVGGRRNLLAAVVEEEDEPPAVLKTNPKKKTIMLETKNQTKPTKLKKSNSTATATTTTTTKIKLNKTLNSSATNPKPSNSSIKSNSSKIQLKSFNSTSNSPKSKKKNLDPSPKPQSQQPPTKTNDKKKQQPKNPQKQNPVPWFAGDDLDGGDDLIADFHGLSSQLLPDLEHLSATSKTYISIANKGIADGVKPYVGHKYAAAVASVASAAFLFLPLLLLSLLFHRFRSFLSLQTVLTFAQAYLAIYFATLAAAALATGLEPLRFFYETSPAAYAATQALQALGYAMYLLAQLVHIVAVFSGGGKAAERALVLAQTAVGMAVGMHYYAAVFHRAVTGLPPRANWRVHGMYAACFLMICALARAERRKKEYGEDGKNN